ncbi:MAG: hypothetical protein V1799_19975 [bacterium]
MDNSTMQDLMGVYGDQLAPHLFQALVSHLDAAVGTPRQNLIVRTRNDADIPLAYRGTRYFSVVHVARSRPVIFAGAIEMNPQKQPVPVIRFLDDNPALRQIPEEHKFEYRKGNWTNVHLSQDTIGILPDLFHSEIDDYLQRYDLS